jgi:hypothetical protein
MDAGTLRQKNFTINIEQNQLDQKYFQIKKCKFYAWNGVKKNEMLQIIDISN